MSPLSDFEGRVKMTKVIGLTGGIATGKTTVSNMFRQAGIPVIDADQVAKRIQAPNTEALSRIAAAFGPQILLPTGELNRLALGKIVFNNPKARERLNEIMQPLICDEINRQVKVFKEARVPLIVLDVPLLFEEGYNEQCDLVIVVYTDLQTQLQRLMERNHYDRESAKARINSQMSLATKKSYADILINNAGNKEQLQKLVAALIGRLVDN